MNHRHHGDEEDRVHKGEGQAAATGGAAREGQAQFYKGSAVMLHVYHVSKNDAVRRLNRLTGGSRNPLKFGGIFHAGIEVYGQEWSYGGTLEASDSGVEMNLPKQHNQHQYYSSVHLGDTKLSPSEVMNILRRLVGLWPGGNYDLYVILKTVRDAPETPSCQLTCWLGICFTCRRIHNNCCHFADAFAVSSLQLPPPIIPFLLPGTLTHDA